MEELKIEWKTEGFVNDAAYSFYIHEVIEPFKDKFPGAASLTINIREEMPNEAVLNLDRNPITISSDRKTITIRQGVHKSYKNGKVTSIPEPHTVLSVLRALLERAVSDFNRSA